MSERRVPGDAPLRATYEEFDVGSARVAMIADPENGHAWIQSDVVTEVER
jgi:hypothetical protein